MKIERVAEWLLVAVMLVLPLQTRYIIAQGAINDGAWEYGTISFYAVDVFILLFLFFAAGIIVLSQQYHRLPLHVSIGLFFLLITFFSMSFAINRAVALFWFWKLAEGVALFIALALLPLRKKFVAWALMLAGAAEALYGFTQFLIQHIDSSTFFGIAAQDPATHGVSVIETLAGRVLRAYGTFPHPNILAGFLAVTIVVGFLWYVTLRPSWLRVMVAVSVSLASLGLWLTFSRQAFFAVGVVLAIIIFITFFRQHFFPKEMTAAAICVLLPMMIFSLLFPTLITTRVVGNTRLEIQSREQRSALRSESMELLKTQWLTGGGIGNYTAQVYERDRAQHAERDADDYQPVHNIYLLVLNELGLFGLATFVFFIISVVAHATMPWRAAFATLAIVGLFDHYLWSLHVGILFFWLIAGLATNRSAADTDT